MAWYPKAKKLEVARAKNQPKIVPVIAIDHTQVGTGSLYHYWNTNTLGVESHFWVGLDGTVEQYVDTTTRADANYKANRWLAGGRYLGAISIETENSRPAVNAYYQRNDHAAIDNDPWTATQLASLRELHDWLAATHPTIARRRATGEFGTGLGYHSMWGTGPTGWIPYSSRGKTCPGRARIDQWNRVLLPAFISSTKPSTSGGLTMSEAARLDRRIDTMRNATLLLIENANRRIDTLRNATKLIVTAEGNEREKAIAQLEAAVDELETELDALRTA